MPARIACATDRNFGFSSLFLRVVASWRVNVDASHSRTSGGTASGCTSDNSSSSSAKRLFSFLFYYFTKVVWEEKKRKTILVNIRNLCQQFNKRNNSTNAKCVILYVQNVVC